MTDCTPLYTLVLIVFGIALGLLGVALNDEWKYLQNKRKFIKRR